MIEQIQTDKTDDTEALGFQLAKKVSGGTVIALHGDLGAGKTVFARGFARGLGIVEPVTSPTFSIIQEYPSETLTLFHMDMYRINGEEDALAFGIEDFLSDTTAVCLIEWPERIAELLPADHWQVQIQKLNESERCITVVRPGQADFYSSSSRFRKPEIITGT